MGNKWSKSKFAGWTEVRTRMRQTSPEPEPEPCAPGVGAVSRELAARGGIPSSYTPQNNAALAFLESHQDEEVGFPVRPQVPLRPMTFKGAFDLSFFLKENGGLDGLIYSYQRAEILDLWVYNTQGFFPDWQCYTPGPGIRYPLTFGWLFKLVPVSEEEAERLGNKCERASLLHPACDHGHEDPHKEMLKWQFDRALGINHVALQLHPELFPK
ncbi:nef protein [Human immunodeficiency virus 1]|uniref:Protein Nef n=1 Tax=Human immunodeficiency virus type 1 TaxID=11676 RepID=A0A0U4EDU2_HV1|nr:nef protein [Human immunodeficiency virus 1]APZ84129.1 nef protein [Human immunodeficiency virus 1]ATZ77187.1 nef protein [Human immunodeficiency virus 1]